MKLRVGWLADAEDADSYSARESRVLLRAIARRAHVVPLWFAVGSAEPPHHWNGIRVFPIPEECLSSASFLATLLDQQRPHVVFSNLEQGRFPAGFEQLAREGRPWVHRISPEDAGSERLPAASAVLVGEDRFEAKSGNEIVVPYLRGLDAKVRSGADPTAVLQLLGEILLGEQRAATVARMRHPTHLVMRQQLFCNTSLAQVMFELTNALIELGMPTVAQAEHSILSKGFIHCEQDLLRTGAPDKHSRVLTSIGKPYDPENAVTVHFALFKPGTRYARHGVFPCLAGREVLYTTGNHSVAPAHVRELMDHFERIIAPSRHVLRPYLEAGLSPRLGAVVPHGVDPAVFSPESEPWAYPTRKGFKFLQTSFPWVYEKGLDLTIQAFCRAFSSHDDVTLILRIPRLRQVAERDTTFGRLERLVAAAVANADAPEIKLLEIDVQPSRRGGVYTGADCYVHPLRAEGFGMTILEAMACGLPVIATPWSGPEDFLSARYAYTLRHSNPVAERARNGTLLRYHVEPELDHLIHWMRHAYTHREEGRRLGQAAARVARGDWTWRHAAEKLASLFALQPSESSLRPISLVSSRTGDGGETGMLIGVR
jgi:glycosyltransferase involved in cell wall biosynthesis